MINPFDRFYDTEISVYTAEKNSYTKKGEKKLLGKLVCDIQPYENQTVSEISSLTENRSYKLFCDANDLLKNGRYICFGNVWYMIVRCENWSFGMTAVMRSMENES